ncbi:MAG: hypothetical protein AB1649_32020, partial [Chloroflexota bacterium]
SAMARFLAGPKELLFDAVEFQATFHLGRETARRLLQCFMERRLIEGIGGPQGKRITRYRRCLGADVETRGKRTR